MYSQNWQSLHRHLNQYNCQRVALGWFIKPVHVKSAASCKCACVRACVLILNSRLGRTSPYNKQVQAYLVCSTTVPWISRQYCCTVQVMGAFELGHYRMQNDASMALTKTLQTSCPWSWKNCRPISGQQQQQHFHSFSFDAGLWITEQSKKKKCPHSDSNWGSLHY